MPSSKGPTITSSAHKSKESRRPPQLTLNLGPTTSKSRGRRPAGLSLNLNPQKSTQKPVQTIHQYCDAEKVNEGCDRILRLDENRKYRNITGEYNIEFNEKNIITTLKKVSGEGNYEITNLKTGDTGKGQNILSLLHGKKDNIDIVVKTNLLYKDLKRNEHETALSRHINSVKLQNEAAEIGIAPKIFDYFIYEIAGTIYSVIVMEKIKGRPINKSDNEEAIKKVLNELHNTGIMHGDINPGNIIKVDGEDDKYMLIDFDMAEKSQQGKELSDSDTAVNTLRLSQIFASNSRGNRVFGKTKKRKNKKQTRKVKRGKKTKYSTVKR